jgi:hypothetical protein
MKAFILSLVLLLGFPAYTQSPPVSLKGQDQPSANLPAWNLQVPFSQSTKTGGINALIETGNTNLLANPGFEHSTFSTGWTASGGTSAVGTGSDVGTGVKSYSWDASAASQTLTSAAVTIPAGLYLTNGEASCIFKTTATDYLLQAHDGTNLLAERTIPASANFARVTLNFPMPSSGTIALRVASASNADAIILDDCYLGPARNIGTVAQATFVGTVRVDGANLNNTSVSGGANFGTINNAAFGTVSYTVSGPLTAPTTNRAGFTYVNMPPGRYVISVVGAMGKNAVSGGYCQYRLTDGTNNSQIVSAANGTSATTQIPSWEAELTYTTSATREINIQVAQDVAGQCFAPLAASLGPITIYVTRFPTREEQVLRHDQVAWRVDANIGGANPSLGTGNVSDYTEITNGSLDLVNNSGPGVIPAQIPCSGTNPPTGLTCAAGNESVGVSFNLPAAGSVTACASFTHDTSIGVSSSSSATFQIVETPNDAQTILQEGKERVTSGSTTNSTNGNILRLPRKVCGNFDFTSAGQKTLRLMYEQVSTGTINHALILGDRDTSFGQRDIHWEVYPLNTYQPAPLLIGSVISGSSGIERVERAFTLSNCTSSPCTLTSQSGGVSSVTRSGTGAYNINFSPPFSAQPTCTANCTVVGTIEAFADVIISGTGSVSNVTCRRRDNGAVADAAFSVICMGPR